MFGDINQFGRGLARRLSDFDVRLLRKWQSPSDRFLAEFSLFDRETESPQPMLLIVKVAQFDLNRVLPLTQVYRKIGDFKTTIVPTGGYLLTSHH